MGGDELFKAQAKRSWNRILVVSLSILISVILILSWLWVQRSTLLLLENKKQFLQVYTENLQTTIFAPIEKAALRVQMLLRFHEQGERNLDLVQELFDLRQTSSSLDRSWIVSSDGTEFYAPNVNKPVTERNPWWKAYMTEEKQSMLKLLGSRGFNAFGFEVAEAFRDDLDLSTLLPVVFWYRTEEGGIAFAFLEFNLTSLLIQQVNTYQVGFGDDFTPIEVIVYDREGRALESSRNIPLQVQPMLQHEKDSHVLDSIDLSNGMVFAKEDAYVSMFSRNTQLGLTFSTRISWTKIINQSRKNYLFILIMTGLFSLVFIVLMIAFNKMYVNLRHYEAMQAQSRFEVLQARMNPHFLFNTLDSLVSIIELGNKKQSLEALRALSYILHFDLREKRNEIPLLSEIRYIRNYVHLQKIRYRDLVSFDLDIQETVPEDIRILKYCVQPLVENCFVHGVYLRQKPISIRVVMLCNEQGLTVKVSDDGPGCSAEVIADLKEKLGRTTSSYSQETLNVRGKHIGLLNIHQRILYAYGQGYGLHLVPSEQGFSVEVRLPFVYRSEEEEMNPKDVQVL